ncbi:MAG: ATP-binding protein [Deltaproteobacteria bacterium]|nr:ATP-binding protein [Deltaproteobacteria bacterium]
MLIEFSVGNYRSFKDVVTFSMVAANLKSKDPKLDENNIFNYRKSVNLVKTAAIYGANASGKSNFIKALDFMKKFILNSSKETQIAEEINVENFRLCTSTETQPSFFEIVFVIGEIRYRYGFELDMEIIRSEWLFHAKHKETNLFHRTPEGIYVKNTFKEGKKWTTDTRPNALFLSVCAQWNGEISTKILKWFMNCGIISGLDDIGYRPYSVGQLEDPKTKEKILSFVRDFDLGISDLNVKHTAVTEESLPKGLPEPLHKFLIEQGGQHTTVNTVHKKFNEKGEHIADEIFDLDKHESDGTRKAFSFSGPLLDVIANGKTLIVDELDARFHPIITQAIVQIFQDPHMNKYNAQLIFATHDTNLLNNKFFRRDQVWFMEKNRFGATDLYSLVDFKIRNDASFEKDYIAGKYGAIPFLGGIKRLGD